MAISVGDIVKLIFARRQKAIEAHEFGIFNSMTGLLNDIVKMDSASEQVNPADRKMFDNISTSQCRHGVDWGAPCLACGR
jgi:hypothetical protein